MRYVYAYDVENDQVVLLEVDSNDAVLSVRELPAIVLETDDEAEEEDQEEEPAVASAPQVPKKRTAPKGFIENRVPRGEPKPCCGSKGARHMKGCAGALAPYSGTVGAQARKDEEGWDAYEAPIAEDRFQDLKMLQLEQGMGEDDIATEMELDAAEVMLAMRSKDFPHYTKLSRKTAFAG